MDTHVMHMLDGIFNATHQSPCSFSMCALWLALCDVIKGHQKSGQQFVASALWESFLKVEQQLFQQPFYRRLQTQG